MNPVVADARDALRRRPLRAGVHARGMSTEMSGRSATPRDSRRGGRRRCDSAPPPTLRRRPARRRDSEMKVSRTPEAGRDVDPAWGTSSSTTSTRRSSASCRSTAACPTPSSAPKVGLSQAAVRQRVQRLIDSGVMQVVAVTDPARRSASPCRRWSGSGRRRPARAGRGARRGRRDRLRGGQPRAASTCCSRWCASGHEELFDAAQRRGPGHARACRTPRCSPTSTWRSRPTPGAPADRGCSASRRPRQPARHPASYPGPHRGPRPGR